jgi:hypothetical protein
MTRLALCAAVLLTLTACGKAGAPVVPGSPFPMTYPDPKLAPTAPVRPAPEDQEALTSGGKAKFTDKGSYIDPAVHSTELQQGAVQAGSILNSQTRSGDTTSSPFTQSLGVPTLSPLPTTTNQPDTPQQ